MPKEAQPSPKGLPVPRNGPKAEVTRMRPPSRLAAAAPAKVPARPAKVPAKPAKVPARAAKASTSPPAKARPAIAPGKAKVAARPAGKPLRKAANGQRVTVAKALPGAA